MTNPMSLILSLYIGVRSDFDNIDNEALDFEQLEAFIQNNGVVHSPAQQNSQTVLDNSQQINQSTNLPESPPDSGSEPPYSPNIKVNLPMEHLQQSMNTLTELHVPHHQSHHHHQQHNLLTANPDLYLSAEQQQHQQLIQINSMLHKHENPILQSQQDQMLLYQVSQNGQIMELNQIHQQQQNHTMGSRLYKNDLIELDGAIPLPAMHGIQPPLNTALNDNLAIIENFPRNIEHLTPTDQVTLPPHVKGKRKGDRGGGNKPYHKAESENFNNFLLQFN